MVLYTEEKIFVRSFPNGVNIIPAVGYVHDKFFFLVAVRQIPNAC